MAGARKGKGGGEIGRARNTRSEGEWKLLPPPPLPPSPASRAYARFRFPFSLSLFSACHAGYPCFRSSPTTESLEQANCSRLLHHRQVSYSTRKYQLFTTSGSSQSLQGIARLYRLTGGCHGYCTLRVVPFRVLPVPRISRGHLLMIFFRATHDGLSERWTTRSLSLKPLTLLTISLRISTNSLLTVLLSATVSTLIP